MNAVPMVFHHVPVSVCVSHLIASALFFKARLPAWGLFLMGVAALPATAEDRLAQSRAVAQAEAFATCAGRFSAVAARRVAHHDPSSDQATRLEHDFDALVDAILPIAVEEGLDPRRARHWRVAGWTEMAHLMRLRHSKKDRSRADRAERTIARRLATCTRMVLPG